MNPAELLECSWGNIRLFASQVHTDSGRTQVVHELSSGDIHPVQDRGLRVRRIRLQLQFDSFPNSLAPLEAVRELEDAKNSGRTAIFQHPILGRFLASVGEFMQTIDGDSTISAEAEFIQEQADIAVTPTGAASSGTSGESSVASAAQALDGELAKVGLLKMSGSSAAAVLARVPGRSGVLSRINAARGAFDMTVSSATAFVSSVTAQVTATANSISSEVSGVVGAPVAAGFSAAGSVSALDALLLSPLGRNIDPTSVVPAPSGFGNGDPAATLASVSVSEAASGNFAPTTMDARVAVSGWTVRDSPPRQIMIDAARISNNIAIVIEAGGLELDIALWPAFRAAIMLGEAVRSAAIAATSETPSVFVMRIVQPTALLPLAARIYGGAAAQDRARQISELNDISTPGWLPAGDYLMPTRPPGALF